ncbi:MAG: SprT-like domain-containing protein [Turicibacter sp.]|nr:SprT-like domain-containing protein [Turicibacter sp.]
MKIHLREEAQKFLDTYYEGLPLTIPIEVSGRLSRSLGHFKYDARRNPLSITLAKRMFSLENQHLILGTLYHELVHYACFVKGAPYKDGHPYFERELIRCNAPATRTQGYADKTQLKVHVYGCQKCQKNFNRRRKLRSTDSYGKVVTSHGCPCGGKLRYLGFEELTV